MSSAKRETRNFRHIKKIKRSISHHWILGFNHSENTDTLPKPSRSETSLRLFLIMVSLLLYHMKSPLYRRKLNPTTRNFLLFTLNCLPFLIKTKCCNLLLSRTSSIDHLQTMLKSPNMSKIPNVACFQERVPHLSSQADRESCRGAELGRGVQQR